MYPTDILLDERDEYQRAIQNFKTIEWQREEDKRWSKQKGKLGGNPRTRASIQPSTQLRRNVLEKIKMF